MHIYKILLITARIVAPPVDGGARYVYNTAKSLAERGHKLTFISFKSNKHVQSPELIEEFADIIYQDFDYKKYGIVALLKSIIQAKPIIIVNRTNVRKMALLLERIDFVPDLIFLEGIHAAEMIDYTRQKFPSTKLILRQANVEYQLLKRQAKITRNLFLKFFLNYQSKLMYKYEFNAFKKLDGISAISESDLQEFIKMHPTGNFFNVNIQMNVNKDNVGSETGNYLIAISDWTWHPNMAGMKWFLELVYPILIQRGVVFKLDVIGKGMNDENFAKYPEINYLGFVENINKYYQDADIFIAPLIYGGGTKVKVIEALSHAMPIVTTSYGNEGINAIDGKGIMIGDSPILFATKIQQLICNLTMRREMSDSAYSFAELNFDSKTIIDELSMN